MLLFNGFPSKKQHLKLLSGCVEERATQKGRLPLVGGWRLGGAYFHLPMPGGQVKGRSLGGQILYEVRNLGEPVFVQ